MRIVLHEENFASIARLVVDGKDALLTEIGFFVPDHYLRDREMKTIELPQEITLHICVDIFSNYPVADCNELLSYCIERVSDTKAKIEFQLCIEKESWNENYYLDTYGKKAKDVVLDRERTIGDISFEKFDDKENFLSLNFYSFIESEFLDYIFEFIDGIAFDIRVGLDAALRKPIRSIYNVNDEVEFTKDIVIPLIRRQGYIYVRYNHGVREFGKDLIFLKKTDSDNIELWAAQVKYGDIRGGSKGDTYLILNQIRTAFSAPVIDLFNCTKQRIDKLLIIASGNITENAKEEIYNGVEIFLPSLKNCIKFIDRQGIEDLTFRYF